MTHKKPKKSAQKSSKRCVQYPSLAILKYLLEREAWSENDAIKITRIARELCLSTAEIAFVCNRLSCPWFVILNRAENEHGRCTSELYISIDPDKIIKHSEVLAQRAHNLLARAEHLRECGVEIHKLSEQVSNMR